MKLAPIQQFPLHGFPRFQTNGGSQGQGKADVEAVLQYFCLLSELQVQVPSKSTLQRYDQWWEEGHVRDIIQKLLGLGADTPEQLGLAEPLDLESCFLDTTCLAAHIHYPVDWVLLRDATRTLMKAVVLIRQQGLKHRMEEPPTGLSGDAGSTLPLSELSEKPGDKIGRYKLPRFITYVELMQRSPSGKPDYKWAKEVAVGGAP